MSNLFSPLRPYRQKIKYKIGKYPIIFYPIFSFSPKFRSLSVDSKTELVIEGFPRSANTFSVLAFQRIQSRKIKLAHHLHVPSQILRGLKLGIPIMLLIRNPKDVTISYSIHYPSVPLEQILREYIDYYTFLYNFRSAYSVACFEEIISDYEKIINRLNCKFRTNFISRKLSSQEEEEIFNKIRKLYVSSDIYSQRKIEEQRNLYISGQKDIIKQKIRSELEKNKYRILLKDAEFIYQKYLYLL